MNTSKRTRAEQVLDRLQEAAGGWVDGSELATEIVGGSEGLKRLRELRAEGHPIQERRHPDPDRSIWQYRLVVSPLREGVPFSPVDLPGETAAKVNSGMRPNAMPGRPDRYVSMDLARRQAAEQSGIEDRKRWEAALAADVEARRAVPWLAVPPRVNFGDVLCRSCKGTGGNQGDGPCRGCAGKGVQG